jgi:GNAT superfamily N-acetyltransferase
MTAYGEWSEELEIDGERYAADRIDQSFAKRAGVSGIYAINGAPLRFRREIVRSAQVCDVPHTWRVKQCATESEVTPDVIEQGLVVLANDEHQRGARIITFVAPSNQGYEFLSAGAIRNKLTREYQDDAYPVISRAVVAPKYRGKGLGSLLVEHRLKAAQRLFSKKPKAIHFATESDKMRHAFSKAAAEQGLTFVYIGDEQYETADGVHTVHDYLAYMPWYQAELLNFCEQLLGMATSQSAVNEFRDALRLFMQHGVAMVSGSELAQRLATLKSSLPSNAQTIKALEAFHEVLTIRGIIGAKDPVQR